VREFKAGFLRMKAEGRECLGCVLGGLKGAYPGFRSHKSDDTLTKMMARLGGRAEEIANDVDFELTAGTRNGRPYKFARYASGPKPTEYLSGMSTNEWNLFMVGPARGTHSAGVIVRSTATGQSFWWLDQGGAVGMNASGVDARILFFTQYGANRPLPSGEARSLVLDMWQLRK
jgi:hypothetical protein